MIHYGLDTVISVSELVKNGNNDRDKRGVRAWDPNWRIILRLFILLIRQQLRLFRFHTASAEIVVEPFAC